MRLKHLALAAFAFATLSTHAAAELVFPSLVYRTGPYAADGIPVADGYADYFTLLNERDGGIGGVKAKVVECETGYDTDRGVDCYEKTKGLGALVYQPTSTGVVERLLPRTRVDGIPILSVGYGRTFTANGRYFSHVFSFPANYWHGASALVNHMLDQNGGNIKGKSLALLYLDIAYGREPIRTLEALSKKHGFELVLLPVDPPGDRQRKQWKKIKRMKPDYVAMWGWGKMNPVAIRSAAKIDFPMGNFIGIWWSASELDVLPAGDAADGYKTLGLHNVGDDYPIYDDLRKYVLGAGKAAGDGDAVGTVLYNRGLYSAMLAAEAARTAQRISGKANITAADMRDGMEALEITEARNAELGLPDFGPSFKASCENHGGPGLVAIHQWDAGAGEWRPAKGFMPTDTELVNALVEEESKAYAAEHGLKDRC